MSFFFFFPMMNFGEGLLDRTRCGVYFWKCYFSREFVIFSQERREEGDTRWRKCKFYNSCCENL